MFVPVRVRPLVLRKELEDFHSITQQSQDVGEEGTSLTRRCRYTLRERISTAFEIRLKDRESVPYQTGSLPSKLKVKCVVRIRLDLLLKEGGNITLEKEG